MINNFSYLSIFVVALQLSSILAAPQLSYKKCLMEDSDCLKREGKEYLIWFVDGIPEFQVEKLDEMYIDTIEMNTDGIDQELQNVKISGLRNAKINDLSFDTNFNIMRLSFDANLTANADYTLDGVFSKQPIVGTGTTTYTIKNIQMDMLIFYDVKNEDGKHKPKIRRYRSGYTIKDRVEYQYNNLFNEDKQIDEALNAFLNKNSVIINGEFGDQFYSEMFDKIFEAIKAFARYHYLEDLFLDS